MFLRLHNKLADAHATGADAWSFERVRQEVGFHYQWVVVNDFLPTIVALRQRFDAIRRSELQRLEGKLAGLPPDARARVDEVTRLIVEKLLLEPTEQLKALPDEETTAQINRERTLILTRRSTLDYFSNCLAIVCSCMFDVPS